MKKARFLKILAVAAAAGATAIIVPAQGPPEPQRDPAARAEFLRKFDKDGDGRVSREEIEQARAAGELKGNGRKNRDAGSSDQRGAAGDKKNGQPDLTNDRLIQKLLDEFDADHNGKLNFDEMAACREAMKKRGPAADPPPAATERRRADAP